jgi:hypothetical protein
VRFSLLTMLLMVTGVAVLCASLLFAEPWIGSVFYTALLAMILAALVAAIQRQGLQRAYWIGFLVGSAGYAWQALPSGLGLTSTISSLQLLNAPMPTPQLITTDVLVLLYENYSIREPDTRGSSAMSRFQARAGSPFSNSVSQRALLPYVDSHCAAFVLIGQSAIAVGCGLALGGLSSRLYRLRTGTSAIG